MALKPWDFWADRYDRLWVQKHSLGPTREYVLETLDEAVRRGEVSVCAKLMDLGCGSGILAVAAALVSSLTGAVKE